MTGGAVEVDLTRSLDEARLVYDELARLQARAVALKTVDDARIAYDALLNGETRAIADLKRDRDALLDEQRRRRVRTAQIEAAAPPPPRVAGRPVTSGPAPNDAAPERPPRLQGADRRTLKKLVSRWQFAWSLAPEVVAQVNSIADDAGRPLGEALALLEWRLYESRIPGESPESHVARVHEWRDVLTAYLDHLRAEIATTETRYRNVLAIWERWSNAQAGEEGRKEWDRFIAATRTQKANEIASLTTEVTALREALGL
jgi:hypothetical protein